MSHYLPYIFLVLITFVTVLGDSFLKKATQHAYPANIPYFLGTILIAILNFLAFYYIYKHLALSVTGVLYSVLTILFSVTLGVVIFKETLATSEILGIVLCIIGILLLSRF